MSARERILERLRAAPSLPEVLPDVAGWFAAHRRNEDLAQRVARLRSGLEGYHAEVHDTTDADWPDLLLRIAATKHLRNLLIGTDTLHGATLEARALDTPQLVPYDRSIESWRDRLFDAIDASLTLARSAIADTGSLILWPDAREPRLMSLVPPVHFVLLDAATIHADFHSAMVAENWQAGLPTNALLISGPSKTADIQQTLAYGAHGPRELIVLLRHGPGDMA
ncbi:MAG: lactate utilization protein [Betaproteobacteria bacterium]|nr:lactate utilization protein [Betaproteobacteria bacterium]